MGCGAAASTDERELLRRARQGDREARNEIVQRNIGLVRKVLGRFPGHDQDDLFQVGCIGLLKAAERYDPGFGTAFSTYAVPTIIGEIRRYLRDDAPLQGRSAVELARKARKAREEIQREEGREPSLNEVAARIGASAVDTVAALDAAGGVTSIFKEVYDEGGDAVLLGDRLAGEDGRESWTENLALMEGLRRLPERERAVLVMRFFQDRTQQEVAERIGVSQVQVSRLEKRAIMRIRQMMK